MKLEAKKRLLLTAAISNETKAEFLKSLKIPGWVLSKGSFGIGLKSPGTHRQTFGDLQALLKTKGLRFKEAPPPSTWDFFVGNKIKLNYDPGSSSRRPGLYVVTCPEVSRGEDLLTSLAKALKAFKPKLDEGDSGEMLTIKVAASKGPTTAKSVLDLAGEVVGFKPNASKLAKVIEDANTIHFRDIVYKAKGTKGVFHLQYEDLDSSVELYIWVNA